MESAGGYIDCFKEMIESRTNKQAGMQGKQGRGHMFQVIFGPGFLFRSRTSARFAKSLQFASPRTIIRTIVQSPSHINSHISLASPCILPNSFSPKLRGSRSLFQWGVLGETSVKLPIGRPARWPTSTSPPCTGLWPSSLPPASRPLLLHFATI